VFTVDPDTLHMGEPNALRWSRTNFEEAMPGVLTPISWSFWGHCSELSFRRIMSRRFGVFRADELTDTLPDTMTTLFYGRASANLDLMARAVSRVPGSDVEAFERQFFGEVCGVAPAAERRLRPYLLLPASAVLAPRRVRTVRRRIDRWWRRCVSSTPEDLHHAVALARDALGRFVHTMTEHGFAGMLGQGFYQQLVDLCADAGHPGLELEIVASGKGLEETRMTEDVRAAAEGRLTLEALLWRHGFHGPQEGEVSSRSWREDPAPLLAMIERVGAGHDPTPEAVARRRREALATLRRQLGPAGRARARLVLRGVDTYLPLREIGKAAFLQCVDVGRHAVHAAGRILTARGRLADPDDVRYLTLDEITAGGIDPDRVELRRRRRTELLGIEVPLQWVGQPVVHASSGCRAAVDHACAVATATPTGTGRAGHAPAGVPNVGHGTDPGGVVRGIPGSAGRHRGTARVVLGPDDYERIEPGDVMVCPLTDPAWAPLFAVAGAVVIDVGSALSHGAIIAREMGLPCVIGTVDGTTSIPDGALVDVDGDAGTVQIVTAPPIRPGARPA